jgi:hypothetical protein
MRLARFGLITAALSLAYYEFGNLVYSKLPYVQIPSQWTWPSRRIGVLAWFLLLNITGALLAALPVALLVAAVRFIHAKLWVSVAVGVVTAVAVYLPIAFWERPAYPPPSWMLWANNVPHFLSIVLAVPLLVRLMIALPSNNRWRGP